VFSQYRRLEEISVFVTQVTVVTSSRVDHRDDLVSREVVPRDLDLERTN
jgi:hypothetical protein